MNKFKIISSTIIIISLSACKYKEVHSDNFFAYDSGRYTRYNFDNNMLFKTTSNLDEDTISFHITNISKENITAPLLSLGRPSGVDIEIKNVAVSHLDPQNGRFYKIKQSHQIIKPGETKIFTFPQSFISYTYRNSVLLRPTLMNENKKITFNFIGLSSDVCYIKHVEQNNFFEKYHKLNNSYKKDQQIINEFNDLMINQNLINLINNDQFNKLPVLQKLHLIKFEMNSIKQEFNLDLFNDFNSKTNLNNLFKDDYLNLIQEQEKKLNFNFNTKQKLNSYIQLATIYKNITKDVSKNENIPEIWLDFYSFDGFDFKQSETTLKLLENTPNVRFVCTEEKNLNSFWAFLNKTGKTGEYKYVW